MNIVLVLISFINLWICDIFKNVRIIIYYCQINYCCLLFIICKASYCFHPLIFIVCYSER
nr:MAG TPA: hypothetical protein [Caudoviricetes sp.]